MSKDKSLLDYGKFFPPNEYEKNDLFGFIYHRFILKKIYCIKFNKYRKFKNPKISNISVKTTFLNKKEYYGNEGLGFSNL